MKNSIYNKKEVPERICSMAEEYLYDDFDNPLGSFGIIPKGKEDTVLVKTVENYVSDGEYYEDVHYELSTNIQSPSDAMDEHFTLVIVIPEGVHPFTYLKECVDMNKEWIFLNKDVVEVLRKAPCKYYQKTIAYGEFFRFEDFDEVSLQDVQHFTDWKVILEGKISTEEFYRPERPETIIEVVMG